MHTKQYVQKDNSQHTSVKVGVMHIKQHVQKDNSQHSSKMGVMHTKQHVKKDNSQHSSKMGVMHIKQHAQKDNSKNTSSRMGEMDIKQHVQKDNSQHTSSKMGVMQAWRSKRALKSMRYGLPAISCEPKRLKQRSRGTQGWENTARGKVWGGERNGKEHRERYGAE